VRLISKKIILVTRKIFSISIYKDQLKRKNVFAILSEPPSKSQRNIEIFAVKEVKISSRALRFADKKIL